MRSRQKPNTTAKRDRRSYSRSLSATAVRSYFLSTSSSERGGYCVRMRPSCGERFTGTCGRIVAVSSIRRIDGLITIIVQALS